MPAAEAHHELEIKKSRFIASAHPIENRQQALTIIDQLHKQYPDARHICWAYVLGNQVSAAMSDDGEPSGTAGKPILNVLQHKGLGNILVAVVRYFGGIKLGAGGLVRAYSGAAQNVIETLDTIEYIERFPVEVMLDFSQEQLLRHWCQQHDVEVQNVAYGNQVSMLLACIEEKMAELQDFCDMLGATCRSL